jgi:hypothetical protein
MPVMRDMLRRRAGRARQAQHRGPGLTGARGRATVALVAGTAR